MQKLIQDRHAALFNHFGLALLEHTDSIEDPRVDLQSAAYIVVQHAMGLWAEVMGGREFDKNHVEPEVLLRDKVTLAVERFRRHYTVEVLRRRKLLGDPNSGQSARDPRAPTDAAISAEEQKVRGELRSRWLDDRYAEKDWTSDLDLEQARGPSYNTIQRYRSGKKSNQERSVRQLIAKALGCKPAEVPE